MKPRIEEVLYSQYGVRNTPSMSVKEIFQCNIDFTIDIDNIVAVEMMWERYHNNTIWCQLGLVRDDTEKVLMASQGYPANEITDQKPYGPSMRIDIGTLHEVAICEKHSIPYELILKMKIKYIHVKMRRRVL